MDENGPQNESQVQRLPHFNGIFRIYLYAQNHFYGTIIIGLRKRKSPFEQVECKLWIQIHDMIMTTFLFAHILCMRCYFHSLVLSSFLLHRSTNNSFYLKACLHYFRSAVKRNGTQHHCVQVNGFCMNVQCLRAIVFNRQSWMHCSLLWSDLLCIAMAMMCWMRSHCILAH